LNKNNARSSHPFLPRSILIMVDVMKRFYPKNYVKSNSVHTFMRLKMGSGKDGLDAPLLRWVALRWWKQSPKFWPGKQGHNKGHLRRRPEFAHSSPERTTQVNVIWTSIDTMSAVLGSHTWLIPRENLFPVSWSDSSGALPQCVG